MNALECDGTWSRQAVPSRRRGVTLLEVLAAIVIVGVGMMALLVLFPLGALSMARAVQDDRAANIARDSVTLSLDGMDALAQTRVYLTVSLAVGKADPTTAGKLRDVYEGLAVRAAEIEYRLRQLAPDITDPIVQQQIERLLKQIGAIKSGFDKLAYLMGLIEQGLK